MFNHVQKNVTCLIARFQGYDDDLPLIRTKNNNDIVKTIVLRIEVLSMEVRLLAFVLVSVLQNVHTITAENSGKNSFSCFLMFGHTLSALRFHQYSVSKFTSNTYSESSIH